MTAKIKRQVNQGDARPYFAARGKIILADQAGFRAGLADYDGRLFFHSSISIKSAEC